MKNITTILEEVGITLTEEQKKSVTKSVAENYKTIAEVEKKDIEIDTLKGNLKTVEESLKKFDGVDPEGLKKQISDLNTELANKDKDYQQKLADRDFNDILKDSITSAKGKNATAITALLDIEALKASKNQKEDIATAIKNLKESDGYLFDTQTTPKKGNPPIGSFTHGADNSDELPSRYKDNPYYHA